MAKKAMGAKREALTNKPWAKLRVTRKQYATSRPWKKAGMAKEDFETMLDALPDGIIGEIHEQSDADRLVEAMFGESGE